MIKNKIKINKENEVKLGNVNKIENWSDLNERISKVWKDKIGINILNNLKPYLNENTNNIGNIIIDMIKPQIKTVPYWKPGL